MNSSNAENSQCSPELHTGVEGLAQIVANRDCQFSQEAHLETINIAVYFNVFFTPRPDCGLEKNGRQLDCRNKCSRNAVW